MEIDIMTEVLHALQSQNTLIAVLIGIMLGWMVIDLFDKIWKRKH